MVSLAPVREQVDARISSSVLLGVFGAWSFLASLLLFWVELMVAKMLLPSFGGSASVWNTSLVFFQIALLLGYAIAHLLSRLDSRWHKTIELILVVAPLGTLPIALPAFLESPSGSPVFAVLAALTLMVGAPFFALATASPTLQAWFARSPHPRAADPYFLYALSNVGSLVGLLGYPLLIERLLSLRAQTILWAVGYGLFALMAVVGSRLSRTWVVAPERIVDESPPPVGRRVKWAAVAFVPSLALMGVTRHLSTDVAAFPLLWMLPLALYLASFALAFRESGDRWIRGGERLVRFLIVPAALLLAGASKALWLSFSIPLALLAAVALAAHGAVYRERPAPAHLTHFYLWVSIGGAAGGLFAALIAPVVFDFVVEYPLALILSGLVAGGSVRKSDLPLWVTLGTAVVSITAASLVASDLTLRVLLLGLAGVTAVMWLSSRWLTAVVAVAVVMVSLGGSSPTIEAHRTFFGVYRVVESTDYRSLLSGTTSHGAQVFAGETGSMDPVSYYHPDGPVGDIFDAMGEMRGSKADVGVIGLGIGTLAAYGTEGDVFTFYEIDPMVEELARDPELFTLLRDANADVEVIIGDGRLELERRRPSHDLLIVDAFTSDSIPVHLLTVEAVTTYLGSLSDDGRVLLHISNRHLDLEPIVGRLAAELAADARIMRYVPTDDVELSAASTWVLLERDVDPLLLPESWQPARDDASLWTDDYSNILSVIDWG